MNNVSKKEKGIRIFVRVAAWIAIVVGVIFSSVRFYDLATLVLVDAKVIEVRAHPGRCRVPVGKFIDCTQSEAIVSYVPRASTESKTAEILIAARGATLKAGDELKVAYSPKTPEDVFFPDVEVFLRGPLGMVLVGIFFAGLERLTR